METNEVVLKGKKIKNYLNNHWDTLNRKIYSVVYNKKELFVEIKIVDHESIYFPIMNSNNGEHDLYKHALEPDIILDRYKEKKCMIAGQHNLLTMTAFKILLKDLGISARIVKQKRIRKDLGWGRDTYKIYPKTDADYAYFRTYFNSNIGEKNNIQDMTWFPPAGILRGSARKMKVVKCKK